MDSLTRTLLQVSLGGGAWVLWLLLILSLVSVAIMIERGWIYFRRRFAEDQFVAAIEPLLRQGGWRRAVNLCEENPALELAVPGIPLSWTSTR